MHLGGLIIVYMTYFSFQRFCFWSPQVSLFPFSLLSASCVCPAQINFYILSFCSEYGKTQNPCLNHAAVTVFEGGGRREMFEESQREKLWF